MYTELKPGLRKTFRTPWFFFCFFDVCGEFFTLK